MKILLFTGAGTSISSNLPSTKKIMESLLNGSWRGETDKAQSFLKLLKSYADGYYALRTGRESNYEDLYYLARQICEDAVNTSENPAIGIFIDELKLRVLGTKQFAGQEAELKTIAGQCCNLIHSVVFHELSQKVGQIKGLNLVGKLANDSRITKLDICTLNHDLLFEKYLQSINVLFSDGFLAEMENVNVRFYDYKNFDVSTKVRLFKLHGSIDWYRFKSKLDKDAFPKIGSCDPQHCKNETFERATIAPEFLIGTYNKLAAYEAHIYADLHHWFHWLLREHNTILISGYGWGDSGINQRLFEWVLRSSKNRMVLMQKEDEISFKDLLRESLSILIKREEKVSIEKRQVHLTGKWMCCTRAEEIFEILKLPQARV